MSSDGSTYSPAPTFLKAIGKVDNGICSSRVEELHVEHSNVGIAVGCKQLD